MNFISLSALPKAIAQDMNIPNGSKAKVCSGLKRKINRRDIEGKMAESKAESVQLRLREVAGATSSASVWFPTSTQPTTN